LPLPPAFRKSVTMNAMPAATPVPAPSGEGLRVWVLHDGKPGMRSQALGLAEAAGFPLREISLSVRRPWTWLPPQLWLAPLAAVEEGGRRLAAPWPDLVIGCGRNTVRPALAIRRASGGAALAVHVQDPIFRRTEFDLLVVPEHDRLRGPRVIVTNGALHCVTPQRLAAERRRFPALDGLRRPVLGVLIGGSNRAYRLGLPQLAGIADGVAAALRSTGGSAVVTASRRTGAAGLALLRERLAEAPAAIWDGSGDNPYYAYLAVADVLLVTADSISMISEAAATGKPVYILGLGGDDGKFARFHETMKNRGITRTFAGKIESWSYLPLDDNGRAGAALRRLVAARQVERRPF
jgi:uncharacterized protein